MFDQPGDNIALARSCIFYTAAGQLGSAWRGVGSAAKHSFNKNLMVVASLLQLVCLKWEHNKELDLVDLSAPKS